MPTSTQFNVISLGNFGVDLDPIENDQSRPNPLNPSFGIDDTENEGALVGQTFGSATDPLSNNVQEWISSNPIRNGGASGYNSNDTLQGFRPDGPFSPNGDQAFVIRDQFGRQTTEVFDSFVVARGTVTYTDGTTASTGPFDRWTIVQSQDGDLFLVPTNWTTPNAIALLSAKPVQSIQITDVGGIYGAMSGMGQTGAFVPCFVRGTHIETSVGPVVVEDLEVGDLVRTADHGLQPIRWIGSSMCRAVGRLAPIVISEGALGNQHELRVSPQHRMMLSGWRAELLFGEAEVLASAKSLVNDSSIRQIESGELVEYFHILFDTHEVIFSEGAPSESFHPGEEGWHALDPEMRAEIEALFPELVDGQFQNYGEAARKSLRSFEGALWWHPTSQRV